MEDGEHVGAEPRRIQLRTSCQCAALVNRELFVGAGLPHPPYPPLRRGGTLAASVSVLMSSNSLAAPTRTRCSSSACFNLGHVRSSYP